MFVKLATLVTAIVALLAIAASPFQATAAEKPWLEVHSANFVVVANAGEGNARDMAWQFEQVRMAFQLLWPWARRESGRPFVVFVLRNVTDLRALAPEFWEKGRHGTSAVAVGGADKDYFAILTGLEPQEDVGTNPYYYAYWGYATQMLKANYPGRLPAWYQRGLADFFANALVKKKQVQIGRLITHHLQTLSDGPRMSLPEILGVDWQSRWLTDNDRLRVFDANAWMLVHYLVLGENRAWLPKFNRFAELLKQGIRPDAAFAQAMGDTAAIARGFDAYVGRRLYAYVAVNTDVNVKPASFPVRALTASESFALRAGFHVAMGRPAEARALLAEARKADPPSILADEVEALLLDKENKDAEALELYTRAAKGGSSNFYVHYRRGSLLFRPDSPKETVTEAAAAYAEAVRLNPDHAWAQTSLARALSQVEPGGRAIAAARRSTSLEPGVVAHRLALAQALFSAGKGDEARQEAERSLALATTVEDRADAQRWIDHISRRTSSRAAADTGASSVLLAAGSPEWIEAVTKTCDAGQAAACSALASAHLQGEGVPRDPGRALGLFEKACELSDLRSCSYAAHLKLSSAKGVPKDSAGAARLAAKACEGNVLEGCTTLAVVLLGGSTRAEQDRARTLLKKSCDGGEGNACEILKSLPRAAR